MKKILCICIAAALLLLGACSDTTIRSTDLVYGIYCPESAPLTFPKLNLKDDGNFTFSYKGMGAGSEKGTYSVDDDILTLTCIEGETVFVFEIEDECIIFDAEKSAPIVQEDESATPVVDGTKFVIRHEANR